MLGFERISLNLQLAFVRGVCPFNEIGDRLSCIEELETMWLADGVFGYNVSDGIDELNVLVEDMCESAFGYAIEMGLTGSFGKSLAQDAQFFTTTIFHVRVTICLVFSL